MVNFQLQYECLCCFHFEPLGLRCEMIIMPLELILGHDRVVSEPDYDLVENLFWFTLGKMSDTLDSVLASSCINSFFSINPNCLLGFLVTNLAIPYVL